MSDIEARREARRRRVLGNAEDRLRKITSVEQRNTKCELDGNIILFKSQSRLLG